MPFENALKPVTLRAVIAHFQVEGAHYLHREVHTSEKYQQDSHRHMFHFEVTVNAFENDEMLLNGVAIRRMCVNQFNTDPSMTPTPSTPGMYYFGFMQPLEIAEWMCAALWNALEGRGVRVEVLEDGENGAVVTYGM